MVRIIIQVIPCSDLTIEINQTSEGIYLIEQIKKFCLQVVWLLDIWFCVDKLFLFLAMGYYAMVSQPFLFLHRQIITYFSITIVYKLHTILTQA